MPTYGVFGTRHRRRGAGLARAAERLHLSQPALSKMPRPGNDATAQLFPPTGAKLNSPPPGARCTGGPQPAPDWDDGVALVGDAAAQDARVCGSAR